MQASKCLPIFFIAIVVAFYSCKKNNPAPQSVLIVGKWSVQGDTSRQYINGVVQSTYAVAGINSPYYQFNADGSGTIKDNIGTPDLVANFTYTLSNGILTIDVPQQEADPYGSQVKYQIIKLTSNALILLWEENSPVPGDSNYKEYIYLTK